MPKSFIWDDLQFLVLKILPFYFNFSNIFQIHYFYRTTVKKFVRNELEQKIAFSGTFLLILSVAVILNLRYLIYWLSSKLNTSKKTSFPINRFHIVNQCIFHTSMTYLLPLVKSESLSYMHSIFTNICQVRRYSFMAKSNVKDLERQGLFAVIDTLNKISYKALS